MKRSSIILQRLRSEGYRLTRARKNIIGILERARTPLSAPELHGALTKKGLRVNQVTVYRELAFLVSKGLATLLTFNDGTRRYQMESDKAHKHHLICTSCNLIQEIEMKHDDLHSIETQIEKRRKFDVQSHSLEFYGRCARCS